MQEFCAELQKIWSSLASRGSNTVTIIGLLVHIGMQKKNIAFIPRAKRICTFLAPANPTQVVNTLVNFTDSPVSPTKPPTNLPTEDQSTHHPFDDDVPSLSAQWSLARMHLHLILLTELSFENAHHMKDRLPAILHVRGSDSQYLAYPI